MFIIHVLNHLIYDLTKPVENANLILMSPFLKNLRHKYSSEPCPNKHRNYFRVSKSMTRHIYPIGKVKGIDFQFQYNGERQVRFVLHMWLFAKKKKKRGEPRLPVLPSNRDVGVSIDYISAYTGPLSEVASPYVWMNSKDSCVVTTMVVFYRAQTKGAIWSVASMAELNGVMPSALRKQTPFTALIVNWQPRHRIGVGTVSGVRNDQGLVLR